MNEDKKQNRMLTIMGFLLLFVMLAFVFLCYGVISFGEEKLLEQEKNLVDSSNKFNSNVSIIGADSQTGGSGEVIEEPLFENGKQAFLYAFDLLKSYDRFSLKSSGMTTSSRVGFDKRVANSMEFYKYSDTEYVRISNKYEMPSSISLGLSSGQFLYFSNGKVFENKTKMVSYKNGNIDAKFDYDFNEISMSIPSVFPYKIDIYSISSCRSYKVIKDAKGKILQYDISIELNTTTSVKEYSQIVKSEANASALPEFKNISISCLLDRNGNFTTIKVSEDYSLKVGIITTSCHGELVYRYSDYNKKPNYIVSQI